MFDKVLIANRGEIAVRVIRACKEMGLSTVAVYSEADSEALHVSMADESICIGAAQSKSSYLNIDAVLFAAIHKGAQAIHPGYGLLSENAEFARRCAKVGIKFIGPSPEILESMGDKDVARKTMKDCGVPIVPGTDCIDDKTEAYSAAKKIGFPVLIKARSGGGGKGIRVVHKDSDFLQAFSQASSEAQVAFGDGGCYLEKYLDPVKHIELQILADEHGKVLVLGERECSVQRRNQKMIEESPSKALIEKTRKHMIRTATSACKQINYTNAGTIEYLLDKDGNYYFMEMNTRLQVEHPVTEMVTGVDIVKWQIRIAMGKRLELSSEDIKPYGASIECRINAEDPSRNFAPSAGRIVDFFAPGGPWVRFDSAVYTGYAIPPYYDSMIGKLIVWAKTRDEAIRKMRTALSELHIEGISTNIEIQKEILSHKDFVSGEYYTNFIAKEFS